jgi:hypothetical protein
MKYMFIIILSCSTLCTIHAMEQSEACSSTRNNEVVEYAYTLLKGESASDRSNALRVLFQIRKNDIDNMRLIQANGDDLIYRGQLSKNLTEKTFDYFKSGNFVFDDSVTQANPLTRAKTRCRKNNSTFDKRIYVHGYSL